MCANNTLGECEFFGSRCNESQVLIKDVNGTLHYFLYLLLNFDKTRYSKCLHNLLSIYVNIDAVKA
jgi:hypothetical protein